MKILNHNITAERWPWQRGYNWRGMTSCSAPLNRGLARFGGGWKYKFGVDVGGETLLLNLLFGIICIRRIKPN